jgi:hypothetical protein
MVDRARVELALATEGKGPLAAVLHYTTGPNFVRHLFYNVRAVPRLEL